MITGFDIIYYSIYLLCLVASFKASSKNLPGLIFLRLILVSGLIVEGIVEVLQYFKLNENWPYYAYIPLEYIFMCFYLAANTYKQVLKRIILYSIIPYLLTAFILTATKYKFEFFPAYIYNMNCFLSVIWLVMMLMNLEVVNHHSPLKIPAFWIFTGFLIFYAGIFFFNGAYNYFLKNDPFVADQLRNYINTGLNNLLYSVLTYAFVCSAIMKKY